MEEVLRDRKRNKWHTEELIEAGQGRINYLNHARHIVPSSFLF